MKKIAVALLVLAGTVWAFTGGFQRFSGYTDIAAGKASASSQLTSKIAPGTPLGEQVSSQVQQYESMGQAKLQATQPMQRVQQVSTQIQQPMQQPTQAIQSRFGGGKFF